MSISSVENLRVSVTNRQILKIALPISFALFVPQINFITNNIFLGQLGEQELGVAGLTGVYYLIFAAIGFGLNNGLQALISRRAGENRIEEIGKLFSQGVRISLVIASCGIAITYFVAPVVLKYAIESPETYQQWVQFLRIRIWGLPFLYIYQMRNALLVGTNQSKYLVAGTAAETAANIFFDYTLINGHWGFPRLGFNGAAYASIIAEVLGMFVVFLVIHLKGISRRFSLYGKYGFDRVNTKLILVQSSPLILQHAISIISWIFFYVLIEHHGKRDLAISNTMRNIFGFFGVFTWAFAATTNTMVSNVIGQGKKDQVVTLINKIVRISMLISVSVALVLNLFPHIFLSIYSQGDAFIEEAIPVVRIVSSALILMSFSTVWLNAVTGTGNSKINLYIEMIAIILYCIYVYLVLEIFNLPITIGWMSEWLYWTVLFILSFLYIKSGKWKGKVI
jgi:multidrug resistance protein, MATE family